MTFGEIVQNLRERGIGETTGTYLRNGQGKSCELRDFDSIKSVCAVGALRYARVAGWITEEEEDRLVSRLTDAAARHGYEEVIAANDAGVSFETLAEWEEEA